MDSQGVPPPLVTRQLALIYKLALREWDSGMTFPILSQPQDKGVIKLATSQVFLWHQAAYPFIHMVNHPTHFPNPIREQFWSWCNKVGLSYKPQHLPYIQLGMVRTSSLSFVAWSAKALSQLQSQAPLIKLPPNKEDLLI